ncbi:hypothetical protein IBA8401_28650 [Pseudomonas syringae]
MIRPFLLTLSLALSFCANAAITESHGYAQFGVLKYPASFTHFDWVNPEAPKGGTLRMMAFGTFDTLNPYTFKGSSPVSTGNFLQYGVNELNEPLMVGTGQYDPSGDEPTSSYGLIAQSVEYSEDRSWVVFNLRPQARFHDGKPITAYDVAFSYRTLLKDGHPQYRTALQEVQRVDILNRHRIRFVFKRSGNPLLILRLGELPVLPQHYWKDRDFKATTFEPPLGSGPYRITRVQPGRQLVFERVKDYWGKDLPVNRGKYNFDRVEVEFYRDSDVAFEAFKAGEFDIYIEHQAKNWASGYDFPAVANGQVIKAQIPHRIPTQTQGLFMNTRRAPSPTSACAKPWVCCSISNGPTARCSATPMTARSATTPTASFPRRACRPGPNGCSWRPTAISCPPACSPSRSPRRKPMVAQSRARPCARP